MGLPIGPKYAINKGMGVVAIIVSVLGKGDTVWKQTMKTFLFALIGLFVFIGSVLSFGSETASTQVRTMEVTIFVPADVQKYGEMITGKQDFQRAAGMPFIKKRVVVPYSTNLIRASAAAAAKEVLTQAGPTTIAYMKIENGVAYVLLNIDRDGWAGVSYSWAYCHPIVEKTLLQFKNIDRVVWGEAPGKTTRPLRSTSIAPIDHLSQGV